MSSTLGREQSGDVHIPAAAHNSNHLVERGLVGTAEHGCQGCRAAPFEANAELFPDGVLRIDDLLVAYFNSSDLILQSRCEGVMPDTTWAEAIDGRSRSFNINASAGLQRRTEAAC